MILHSSQLSSQHVRIVRRHSLITKLYFISLQNNETTRYLLYNSSSADTTPQTTISRAHYSIHTKFLGTISGTTPCLILQYLISNRSHPYHLHTFSRRSLRITTGSIYSRCFLRVAPTPTNPTAFATQLFHAIILSQLR